MNKKFLQNRIIRFSFFTLIFALSLAVSILSFSCKSMKAPGEIDWNKVIEFLPIDELKDAGFEEQIFEPIQITLLHTNDTRGNIQPCG